MTLSNIEIKNIAHDMKLPLVFCYSKNTIPMMTYIGSYYVNLENDDGPGSHWTFLRIFENGDAVYFDSFGILPPKDVVQFLERNGFKHTPFNNRQIQDLDSDKCGYFCLACDIFFQYYAKQERSTADNFDDFLNVWSYDTKKNDKILMEFLNKRK